MAVQCGVKQHGSNTTVGLTGMRRQHGKEDGCQWVAHRKLHSAAAHSNCHAGPSSCNTGAQVSMAVSTKSFAPTPWILAGAKPGFSAGEELSSGGYALECKAGWFCCHGKRRREGLGTNDWCWNEHHSYHKHTEQLLPWVKAMVILALQTCPFPQAEDVSDKACCRQLPALPKPRVQPVQNSPTHS